MAWKDDPNVYTPNDASGYGGLWYAYPGSVGSINNQLTTYVWSRDPNTTGRWLLTGGASTAAPSAAVAASTGVNPVETSYSLYGHIIPLSLGKVRIGGDIIAGPWIENGLATFCISFGVPADPFDTRELKEIAFDSEVVWENGAFNIEAFTFRYYPGTLTQAADPIEISHFGAEAVAYRPQMLLWFDKLPIKNTKFQKIPYVAAVIEDSSHGEVNLGWAFEQLAYSPWVGYTDADFETIGVTDGVTNGGMIFAENAEFLSTIQQFGRFYRNWNILQTDKLRIVDRGATVTPDIFLDKTRLMNAIGFTRGEQSSIPRVLELSTIDPDADYTIVPSQAVRPREPVNVSASVSTETAYLPIVMDTHTRQSLVTYTKYQEEVARKTVSSTAMIYGLEIEPGDLVAITGLGDDFRDTTFKIIETLHGANYTVEFTAEAILSCEFLGDPHIVYVVLLMGYEDADGSQGAPGFTDESLRHHGTAGFSSLAQIDTAQSKFGSASLRIPAEASCIRFPNSDDWCLSSSNSDQFTVELWVRFQEITAPEYAPNNMLVGQQFGPTHYAWSFETSGLGGEFAFKYSSDGSTWVSTVSTDAELTDGQWYHLAVDKDASGKIRIYKNGVMVGSATPSNSSIINLDFYELTIGTNAFTGPAMNGWIDELRITKGVARYASDGGFTIPTNPWPRGGVL